MRTILIIDDSADFREIVREMLFDDDYLVFEATCPTEAFELLRNEEVDAIICDLHMPFTQGENQQEFLQSNKVGIETIKELGWVFPNKPIIAASASTPAELHAAMAEFGDLPVLSKPFSSELLIRTLDSALKVQYFDIPQ